MNLRKIAHQEFLKSKRLRHYVHSDRFEKAIANCTDTQLAELLILIKKGSLEDVKAFVEKDRGIEDMDIMQLRNLGKQYGIKYYYNKTRSQLIKDISDAQERYSESSKPVCRES